MRLNISWPVCLGFYLHSIPTAAQCNNATTTLRNAADASSLATCTTFTGTIVMATDAPIPTASLEGVESLDGDLVAINNSYLSNIVSSSLQSVTGSVILSNLPLLSNITLPVWQSVGTLDLSNIPQPATLNMRTTQQQVNAVRVVNTTLEGLFGLSLRHAQMDSIYMVNNRYLQNLEFGVGNISQSAIFQNNGGGPVVLPNLTNAYTLQISNASGVDLPLLESVNADLLLGWNTLSNISAPKLNFVGGDLDITNNAELAELNMNGLVAVQGSLRMTDNAIFTDIRGLPSLDYVGGMLDLVGAFTNASLPSLDNVEGAVIIQSTNNTSVCSGIPAVKSNPSFSCPGSGESTTSSSPGLSKGEITGVAVGVVVPCALAIVVAFSIVCLQRRRRKKTRAGETGRHDYSQVARLRPVEMGSQTVWTKPSRFTKGMAAEPRPGELYTKANTHELGGDGRSLAEME